ncbi:MAG TPA: hypothetical protein VKP11_10835, partial [Frankiaceae bacterium]|nr:hypothetical protein [Frankiaceae bacterium]
EIVRAHAARHAEADSWIQANLPGSATALMSPRIGWVDGPAAWTALQRHRHAVLDALGAAGADLDLRLLAALGEPCYWRSNRGTQLQDDAANRLEMQPRNQGSEFVRTRLRPLAKAVASRQVEAARAGLIGAVVRDEIGKDREDSRTATGLRGPGPTDNAVAWCALWGISQVPLALQVHRPARTATHVRVRAEFFVVPVWRGPWHPARLRSVLNSRALDVAAAATTEENPIPAGDVGAACAWLRDRGVAALVRFPIEVFGSTSAPERRALRGQLVRLGS